MDFLLKMGIFQPAMLVYQRLSRKVNATAIHGSAKRSWGFCPDLNPPEAAGYGGGFLVMVLEDVYHDELVGGFKHFFVHPDLWKIPILTNIFQLGWNHQPVKMISLFQMHRRLTMIFIYIYIFHGQDDISFSNAYSYINIYKYVYIYIYIYMFFFSGGVPKPKLAVSNKSLHF